MSQSILAMAIHFNPDYAPEAWHYFLVFLCLNLVMCLHNIFTLKKTMWIYDVACKYFPVLASYRAVLG